MGCSGSCGSCGGACGEKQESRLKGIGRAILILSGKGGVGKSTVAASLAVTLAQAGRKVGLLDCDFHGPSQPTLFNLRHLKMEGGENGMIPVEKDGVKLASIALLVENPDQAVIWRGPVKMGVIKQLLEEVAWGELDDLILDFPPGTGDESLSACQLIDIPKWAIIVTTPQEVALSDCRKCVDFCRRVEVPVLGIVENMSGFVCPDCSSRHALFGSGGGAQLAKMAGAPLLAEIPLDPAFLKRCDYGELAEGLKESKAVRQELERIAAEITP